MQEVLPRQEGLKYFLSPDNKITSESNSGEYLPNSLVYKSEWRDSAKRLARLMSVPPGRPDQEIHSTEKLKLLLSILAIIIESCRNHILREGPEESSYLN